MRPSSKWNRRGFLGTVAAVAGSILPGSILSGLTLTPRKLFAANRAARASAPVTGFGKTGNPSEELGVTTVINWEGTMTMLGCSLPHPELEAVMTMAGRHFVSIPELEVAAGKRIAEMLKLPDDYTAVVTSGAAAAISAGLGGPFAGGEET